MKWIPKYQKAGKLNFKTTGLPWQQSKQDQEVTRNAQSKGTLNPTNLKNRLQPAAKNLQTKYNNLSVKERIALAKKSMPHSEIVTVRDQQGNIKTSINPKAGAMSGADPVGEFIVGTAAGNLGLGLGKMALSKMGQNAVSHWARNSLLNETAGSLTKNIATPLIESEAVPLEDGFVYRTFTPSHGGFVKNNRIYNRSYGIGDVKVQNGKYYSVRQAHFNNPDKLWWDKFGHNRGRVVQVTKESNTQTLQDAANNGFNLGYGYYTKGYRLSDPIEINKVINYKFDPITNTMVPSMPEKIINNKQTPSEILSTSVDDNPIMQLSYYKPTRKAWSTGKAEGNEATSYFFKQQPNQRFELVKDIEPNNYSVHFKTDRNGLSYGNKMQLFAKVADEVPEGANLSTWGSVSKGGIHGINRFCKDFGFVKVGERQITDKKMNPVNIPIFEKPFSKEFYYKHGVEDLWNDFYQNQQKLSAEFPSSNYYEFIKYPYLVKTPNHQLAYGRVNSKQATQYYNEVIKPKISLITSEQPNVTDYAEATTLPKNIGGIYNTKSRVSNINMPTKSDIRYNEEGKDIASTLVHENYSHGTDDIIPKFIQEKYPVIPKDIEMNLNGHRYLPASHQWYESRATLNEIRFNNPDIKGDQWMNMPENELLRQLWKVNGYGNDFYHHINTLRNPWKKDFIDKLKFALSYLPASTGVPILSMSINSFNNESNKNQTTK